MDSCHQKGGERVEKLLYAELMLICISVLVILLHNDVSRAREPVLLGQSIFRHLILINMAAMLFDGISVVCDGMQTDSGRVIMYISICLYYMTHSLVGYLFILYIDFELYPDKCRFEKRFPYYSILALINMLMGIMSLKTEWFFIIDEYNRYQRGSLWMVPTAVSFFYAVYAIGITLQWARENAAYSSKSGKELFQRLIILPIISCAGAVIQGFLPGSAWTFPCTTLAILINYIAIQNGQMSRDHLTGLYNRGHLENFLNNQIRNLKKGRSVFLILTDLDYFKTINDTFGHLVGDDALIQAARILRDNCKRKQDFVVRLGGDEFVIIGQCQDITTVDMIIERLEKASQKFNESSGKPYQLHFSIGYALGEAETGATLDTLINQADQMMYANKRERKMRAGLENKK